jgi:hypothetical protein
MHAMGGGEVNRGWERDERGCWAAGGLQMVKITVLFYFTVHTITHKIKTMLHEFW